MIAQEHQEIIKRMIAAVQERGRARDLWATVEELLAEWDDS
jgi:hypothetical protein